MRIKKTLKKLPFPIKQSAKYLYGLIPIRLRYGKVFWDTYNFLQESQWWSKEKLEEYQMQQLSKLLHHAYENVPYYRRVFDERDLKPKDIQEFDDLKKLPYLTKEIIKENLHDLIAKNYSKARLQHTSTSGTTGGPLKFYLDKKVSMAREWAFMLIQWKRVGFQLGDKRVILRGDIVHTVNKGKFWEYNSLNRTLILSSYHMTNEVLPKYIKKIREFRPSFIHAYPSAIAILSKWMKENNIQPFQDIKALLCGSENIYSWQRKLLENIFKCRVYSWYGHAEQAVLAGECENSSHYHIFPEYGITELMGKDEKPITKDDELGEIVATGFNNYVMPFIRYKTRDIGTYCKQKCSCGRNYPLLKRIKGRFQEYFVSKSGNLVPFPGYGISLKVSNYIETFQYYQAKNGYVILRIVKKNGYSINDSKKILKELTSRYGNDFDFKIEFFDNISRTKSGKYKYLIQKLPIEFGNS